ncbi:MAG: hypothetical protein RLN72_00885 [Henriciella sp.]
MSKFRNVKTLQKSASVDSSIHIRFNLENHLNRRDTVKRDFSTALAKWHALFA